MPPAHVPAQRPPAIVIRHPVAHARPHPSTPKGRARMPKVSPETIARIAQSLVGTPNRRYYSRARLACASYVSTVLVRAGAVPRGRFSRSASMLAGIVARHGAQVVLRRSPLSVGGARQIRRGDLIFFMTRRGRIGHVGIAVGNGQFVGTSSSRRKVTRYRIAGFPSYRLMRTYRFPSR